MAPVMVAVTVTQPSAGVPCTKLGRGDRDPAVRRRALHKVDRGRTVRGSIPMEVGKVRAPAVDRNDVGGHVRVERVAEGEGLGTLVHLPGSHMAGGIATAWVRAHIALEAIAHAIPVRVLAKAGLTTEVVCCYPAREAGPAWFGDGDDDFIGTGGHAITGTQA